MTLIELKKKADPTLDKELSERYYRLRKDFVWILANEKELRSKYAKKYIAVENKEVKYTNDTIQGIISEIKRSHRQVEDFTIEYVGERPANLLL